MDSSPGPAFNQDNNRPQIEKKNSRRAIFIILALVLFGLLFVIGLEHYLPTSKKSLSDAELRSIAQSAKNLNLAKAEEVDEASEAAQQVEELADELDGAEKESSEANQKAAEVEPKDSEQELALDPSEPIKASETYPLPFYDLPHEDTKAGFKVSKGAYGPQRSEYPSLIDWIKAMQEPEPELGTGQYRILVFIKEQVLAIYDNSNPEQRVLRRAFACSTGEEDGWTPLATTQIGHRREEGLMFDGSFGMYCSQVNGNILIHSVPSYGENGQLGVKPSDWNDLGKPVSHGCIRVSYKAAKFIYENLPIGTAVSVLADASAYPEIPKGVDRLKVPADGPAWDPTNPNPENPYFKEPEILLPVNEALPRE
ncbi:MAG: L,D-transpeptidase [Eubacteriales bacterium]|nr:L,D-transpeptidase [Eubacteriales bacterium]